MRRSLTLLAALALSTCAFGDTISYVATGSQQFGTIDLTNGAFNQLGILGFIPAGLGEMNGTVYTAPYLGSALYSVDTSTGTPTSIGDAGVPYFTFGSTTNGIYTVDSQGVLHQVDVTTGALTTVGSTGINVGAGYTGLSTGASNLYMTVGSSVFSINTATGVGTLVGNTALDSTGALLATGGSLYATTLTNANAAYTLDSTGSYSGTFLSTIGGNPRPDYAYGLVAAAAVPGGVPEPATIGLLSLSGTVLAAYGALRKRAA